MRLGLSLTPGEECAPQMFRKPVYWLNYRRLGSKKISTEDQFWVLQIAKINFRQTVDETKNFNTENNPDRYIHIQFEVRN